MSLRSTKSLMEYTYMSHDQPKANAARHAYAQRAYNICVTVAPLHKLLLCLTVHQPSAPSGRLALYHSLLLCTALQRPCQCGQAVHV